MADAIVPASRSLRWPIAREMGAAVSFLTRIPVRVAGDPVPTTGAAAFGLVGALVGLVASLPLVVLAADHPLLGAVGAIGVVALLSGGLHLDGLGDTFDALAAGPARAEAARTDPRAGSAGVAAIVVVILVEVAALGELALAGGATAALAIVAAATVSRATAPVWAVIVGRRRSVSTGAGAWFAAQTGGAAAAIALATAVVLAILAAIASAWLAASIVVGAAAATLLGGIMIRSRRQLDGDGYGFVIETTVAAILVAAAVGT